MSTEDQVVALAAQAHSTGWSVGNDVSAQTRKAQQTCKQWQQSVKERFGNRFQDECSIDGEKGAPSQKIDLVDVEDRVAYELKASPNNVHMEIYRDVFKALVFNERNPKERITTLIFIAPKAGIQKLGMAFPKDVQSISARLGLALKLRELP